MPATAPLLLLAVELALLLADVEVFEAEVVLPAVVAPAVLVAGVVAPAIGAVDWPSI